MIKNFNELIKKDICIAFFHASWCGDCKILSKTIDNLKDKFNIIDIDTDNNKKLVLQYRIMSIPTLIFFKDGIKKEEITGIVSEDKIFEIINNITEE